MTLADTMVKIKKAVASDIYSFALIKPYFSGLLFLIFWVPQLCGAQNFFVSTESDFGVIYNPSQSPPDYYPDSLSGKGYSSSSSTPTVTLNSNTWPGWFASEPNGLVGIGIAPYSQYNPEKGFDKAFQKATQDLNANAMTSVYLESYSNTGYNTQYHDEYAIPSVYDSTMVTHTDSSVVGDWAFAMVKPKSDTVGKTFRPLPEFNIANWTSPEFFPVNKSGFWISSGRHKKSEYSPYQNWSKAKLDALSKLSQHIQTGVQNRNTSYNQLDSETTYTYSKCLIKNIRVIKRKSDSDSLYVLIAVHQDDIDTLN